MSDGKNLLGMIGICRRAGKAVIGADMVCEHLRKRGKMSGGEENIALLVLEAADTSENTHKKLSDKCIFYNVKHIRLQFDCAALGKAVGKNQAAAVAVVDANFCRAILERLTES
jgi:ribosomal protein L7Ae-like RNA K-turn-binding protein